MIVVADAGPLIHLSLVGRLDLLPALYGRILVPAAVYDEVVRPGTPLPGSAELQGALWAEVVRVDQQREVILRWQEHLDAGEAAALWLALARKADLILSDDRAARHAARELRLPVKGTLGVLVEAKARGLCGALTPLVLELRAKGTWISDDLLEKVVRAAGEAFPPEG